MQPHGQSNILQRLKEAEGSKHCTGLNSGLQVSNNGKNYVNAR